MACGRVRDIWAEAEHLSLGGIVACGRVRDCWPEAENLSTVKKLNCWHAMDAVHCKWLAFLYIDAKRTMCFHSLEGDTAINA